MWINFNYNEKDTYPKKGKYVVQYYDKAINKYRYCEAQFDGTDWACWNVQAYDSIPKGKFYEEDK